MSAYEPSGPSGHSFNQFPSREATTSIFLLPPGWDASLCRYPFIHLVGERNWRVKCLSLKHNVVPRPGLEPEPLKTVQRTNY